jgi:general secretion pathway protein A
MYERFFGLRERPFDLLPNPRFLYLTPKQREALSNLQYGLSTPKGLTLLVGEAGTGKTTLVQAALAELDRDNIECVLVSNPTLTRDEFYEYLAAGFNLGPEAGRSKTRFLFEFRRHLQVRHDDGLMSALVIDEAQSIPYELLEEVRLLSNIETATVKLLNVVLTGQPELATRLNEPQLRQLKQRISLRCQIEPLTFQETAAYIAGRLRIAGGNPAAIFSREAILAIYEASRGIPRVINVVCDNALIGGFASEMRPVLKATVEEVCRDFDLNAPVSPTSSVESTESTEPSNTDETKSSAAGVGLGSLLSSPVEAAILPGIETAIEEAVAQMSRREPRDDFQGSHAHTGTNGANKYDEPAPMFGTVGRRKRFSFF